MVTIFKRTEDYLCEYYRWVLYVAYRVRPAVDDPEVVRVGMTEVGREIEVSGSWRRCWVWADGRMLGVEKLVTGTSTVHGGELGDSREHVRDGV